MTLSTKTLLIIFTIAWIDSQELSMSGAEIISWIARIDVNAMYDSEKNDQINNRFLILHVLVTDVQDFFNREHAA